MKTAFESTIRLGTALLSLALLGAIGCDDDDDRRAARATARIVDTDGDAIGTATFRVIEEGVLVTIDAQGLPAGVHAVHVHERGVCLAPSFESAGSHFDPTSVDHGFADRRAADDRDDAIVEIHAARLAEGDHRPAESERTEPPQPGSVVLRTHAA